MRRPALVNRQYNRRRRRPHPDTHRAGHQGQIWVVMGLPGSSAPPTALHYARPDQKFGGEGEPQASQPEASTNRLSRVVNLLLHWPASLVEPPTRQRGGSRWALMKSQRVAHRSRLGRLSPQRNKGDVQRRGVDVAMLDAGSSVAQHLTSIRQRNA